MATVGLDFFSSRGTCTGPGRTEASWPHGCVFDPTGTIFRIWNKQTHHLSRDDTCSQCSLRRLMGLRHGYNQASDSPKGSPFTTCAKKKLYGQVWRLRNSSVISMHWKCITIYISLLLYIYIHYIYIYDYIRCTPKNHRMAESPPVQPSYYSYDPNTTSLGVVGSQPSPHPKALVATGQSGRQKTWSHNDLKTSCKKSEPTGQHLWPWQSPAFCKFCNFHWNIFTLRP